MLVTVTVTAPSNNIYVACVGYNLEESFIDDVTI